MGERNRLRDCAEGFLAGIACFCCAWGAVDIFGIIVSGIARVCR